MENSSSDDLENEFPPPALVPAGDHLRLAHTRLHGECVTRTGPCAVIGTSPSPRSTSDTVSRGFTAHSACHKMTISGKTFLGGDNCMRPDNNRKATHGELHNPCRKASTDRGISEFVAWLQAILGGETNAAAATVSTNTLLQTSPAPMYRVAAGAASPAIANVNGATSSTTGASSPTARHSHSVFHLLDTLTAAQDPTVVRDTDVAEIPAPAVVFSVPGCVPVNTRSLRAASATHQLKPAQLPEVETLLAVPPVELAIDAATARPSCCDDSVAEPCETDGQKILLTPEQLQREHARSASYAEATQPFKKRPSQKVLCGKTYFPQTSSATAALSDFASKVELLSYLNQTASAPSASHIQKHTSEAASPGEPGASAVCSTEKGYFSVRNCSSWKNVPSSLCAGVGATSRSNKSHSAVLQNPSESQPLRGTLGKGRGKKAVPSIRPRHASVPLRGSAARKPRAGYDANCARICKVTDFSDENKEKSPRTCTHAVTVSTVAGSVGVPQAVATPNGVEGQAPRTAQPPRRVEAGSTEQAAAQQQLSARIATYSTFEWPSAQECAECTSGSREDSEHVSVHACECLD